MFPRHKASQLKTADPQKRVKDTPNSLKYYNQHIAYIDFKSTDDIPYVLGLAKKVLQTY